MHYDQIVEHGLEVLKGAGIDAKFLNLGSETQSQNRINRQYTDSLTFEMRILGSVVSDTRTKIFGVEIPAPITPAPIISSRILDRLAEQESGMSVKSSADRVYLEEYARGVREAGSVMWWGADSKNEMIERTIKQGTKTIVIVKPMRDKAKAKEIVAWAERIGCIAVGMDIDAMYFEKAFDEDEGPDYLAQQTIEDLKRYREATKLPFIVKGILSAHDAEVAVREISASGLVVSMHGGEAIDYTAPVLKVLPEVRAAVGEGVEVLVDSGFRRGTDVLKALALGADGVCFGSLMVLAFAAYKGDGISGMLKTLYRELQRTMSYTGCKSIDSIDKSIIRPV
jgi:4-hydroxymandelate oxidase